MIIESSKDRFLQEDLELTAKDASVPAEELAGSTVLVTGATGLVGSQMVRSLLAINRIRDTQIRVLALIRNRSKAEAVFGELLSREDLTLVEADLNDKDRLFTAVKSAISEKEESLLYIIHGAAVTTSKTMVEKPVETIVTALRGTENILQLAAELKVRSMVYLSSMEVYGRWDGSSIVTEDKMGYVDPLAVRSNYPLGKRMCENMCEAYHSEFGLPVRIARLSQTFGAGILPGENRVFAQFARSVMNGTDIVLHTKGESEGNYCYTADTVRALLIILIRGKEAEAYNISNESTHTTIAKMAQFACEKLAEGKIRVVFDIPEQNTFGYAADTKMKLSSSKLRALGWEPHYSLEDAYRRMMGSMMQNK
jgi:nucleoside-diphosphate-sugar epimerase